MILNKWPFFSSDEIDAVANVLNSGKVNYWTGNKCRQFELEFAQYMGSRYAISLSNGTVSLELALRACGIGQSDEVITSPRTFIASASCIVSVGAQPVFADIDACSQNITAESIQQCISPRTKAIIPVHIAGYPCSMDKIMELADRYNLYVIEDCAQAHGAMYKGKYVGSWGHFGSFSFCQDKIMTTGGEGGMLLCQDDALYQRAWSYKDHGKDFQSCHHPAMTHSGHFQFVHTSFGTNMRMTEMQAAIGCLQLKKLPQWLHRRREIAQRYTDFFKDYAFIHVPVYDDSVMQHAFYKYYMIIDASSPISRDEMICQLTDAQIPCGTGSCGEIYLEKAFGHIPHDSFDKCPNAKKLHQQSLMLLCHPTLSDDAVYHILEVFRRILRC